MPELEAEPLPSNPLAWTGVDMWGWVNRARPFLAAGRAVQGATIQLLAAKGGLRPVVIRFDRPGLVETYGYSWENHLADEMLEIHFLAETIVLSVVENLPDVLVARIVPLAGMARLADRLRTPAHCARVPVSLGDSDGGKPCLAFSSQLDSPWLIPDPYFFLTEAYAGEKREIAAAWKDWSARTPQLYWRGAPSGLQKYENHAQSQRVQLVLRGAKSTTPQLYDVRFASLQGIDSDVGAHVRAAGGLAAPDPQIRVLDYRYNVDVDGWSCAWTGLFIKLLAGSPVLKITSDLRFRQWYYDRLEPWRNFVPVAADLSDIDQCLGVLTARPDRAEEIGAAGRELACSLSFESQFEAGALQICKFAAEKA